MAIQEALVLREAYLHNEDAPGLDDVLVIVSEDEVGFTTKHGNAISLDFDDLAAINRLVAEKKTGIHIQVDASRFYAAAASASLGLAAAFSTSVGQSIREALEAAQQQDRERARCRCHISTSDWQPDRAKIDPQWKYATVDDIGRVWGYSRYPVRNDWNTHEPRHAEIIGHTHDGTVNRDKLYKRELTDKPSTDNLAFLGMSWDKVPTEYNYVAADKSGGVWGYQVPPKQADNFWYAHDKGKRLGMLPPDSVGDWQESLRIRPGHMTNVLGITWADVPAEYHFVAADQDGYVFGYADLRPIQSGNHWWSDFDASIRARYLHATQLPPDLSWRNTLFVRPGYAEPVTPIGL